MQTDDDLDCYGNVCDADFDGSLFVNVTDLLRMLAAFGKNVLAADCLNDANIGGNSCARYDLNGIGPIINISDLQIMISREFFGTANSQHGCAPDHGGVVQCPLP